MGRGSDVDRTGKGPGDDDLLAVMVTGHPVGDDEQSSSPFSRSHTNTRRSFIGDLSPLCVWPIVVGRASGEQTQPPHARRSAGSGKSG